MIYKIKNSNGLEKIIFANTTKMTGMFLGSKKLKDVNLSAIDTTNVTDASYMFYNCLSLNVDKTKLDLENIEIKDKMFDNDLSIVVEQNAKSDKNTDFFATPVTGNYIMESTKNDYNPIYYYRGAVTNNNVLFANKCWKIVRTTETGGVKLIYNGVPAENGSCDNTGTASQIGESMFNSYSSPAYLGYMYGTVYNVAPKDLSNQSQMYLYGNDVTWDGIKYTLSGETKLSSNWSTDKKTLATKYHYTCFNDTGSCQNVYYISSFENANMPYFLTLKNGKNIEDVKREMFTNTTDSKVKTIIDSWYAYNMTSYTDYLEDTVWCNDRTIDDGPLFGKDKGSVNSSIFASYNRNSRAYRQLTVSCSSTRDSFTVDTKNGNGKLTYPVALLTAEEYTLAGSSPFSYLYTGQHQLSMSPSYYSTNYAAVYYLNSSGTLAAKYLSNTNRGIRPAVSIRSGVPVTGGDGSVSNPYTVE